MRYNDWGGYIAAYYLKDNGHNTEALDKFELLPEQARALLINSLIIDEANCGYSIGIINGIVCDGCESESEQIFYMALGIANKHRRQDMHNYDEEKDIVNYDVSFEAYPQYKINIDGHCYRADFMLDVLYYSELIRADSGGPFTQEEKIVIECDGHEYHHANKDQVAHDYDRELSIEKAGYTVMRFTGSMIYNDPVKCANRVIDYTIAKMDRIMEQHAIAKETA